MEDIKLTDNNYEPIWFTFFKTDKELEEYQKECVANTLEVSDFKQLLTDIPDHAIKEDINGDFIISRKALIDTIFKNISINYLYELFATDNNKVRYISELKNHIKSPRKIDIIEGLIQQGYKYFVY